MSTFRDGFPRFPSLTVLTGTGFSIDLRARAHQIELFFGIVQKRVLRYGVFNSLDELDRAVLGFIAHWNANERHPFRWTFKGYPMQRGRRAA